MSLIGTHIGRYEILSVVGEGGMGRVYRARDTRIDRIVALKTLRMDLGNSEDRKSMEMRLQWEAITSGKLFHPNIVITLDAGEWQGTPFLVMEFVQGKALSDLIELQGYIPWQEALEIVAQSCDAVATAHSLEIIHRDIKPENIMVTEHGQVKVTDFGLAKFTTGKELNLTSEGTTVGTLAYLAPERFKGLNSDYRSDIFSLGVVLYEALVGRKPFWGEDVSQVVFALLQTEPTLISEIFPGYPTAIDEVVLKSLAKRADERYQSAADMAHDIRAVLRDPSSGLGGKRVDLTRSFTNLIQKGQEAAVLGDVVDSFLSSLDSIEEQEKAAEDDDFPFDLPTDKAPAKTKGKDDPLKDYQQTTPLSTRLAEFAAEPKPSSRRTVPPGAPAEQKPLKKTESEEILPPWKQKPKQVTSDLHLENEITMPFSNDQVSSEDVAKAVAQAGQEVILRADQLVNAEIVRKGREALTAALRNNDQFETTTVIKRIISTYQDEEVGERLTNAVLAREILPILRKANRDELIDQLFDGFLKIIPQEESSRVLVHCLQTFGNYAKYQEGRGQTGYKDRLIQAMAKDLVENTSRSSSGRKGILKVLNALGDRVALALVVEVFEDTELTGEVFEILKLRGQDVLDILLEKLKTIEKPVVRRKLIDVLKLFARHITKQLAEHLYDQNWEVRRDAMAVLASLKTAKLVPHFARLLKDPVAAVRAEALNALAEVDDPTIEEACMRGVEDSDPEVWGAALKILARIGKNKTAEALAGYLNRFRVFGIGDLGEEVKIEICKTLGSIGSPAAFKALAGIVQEYRWTPGRKDMLQISAIRAIGRINTPEAEKLLEKFAAAGKKGPNIAAKMALEQRRKAQATGEALPDDDRDIPDEG